jgi:methylmalonyl-CoA/ethylmalonyl-CoA epimerase
MRTTEVLFIFSVCLIFVTSELDTCFCELLFDPVRKIHVHCTKSSCKNQEQQMKINKINHVAIVVPDLDQAHKFWVEGLGLSVRATEHVAAQAVDVAFLPVGESQLELLAPTDPESGVARYMDKRGPGMHHICVEVDDIAGMLAHLQSLAIPLIDETPRRDAHGVQYAFVHPKGTNGVLVELYQLPDTAPAQGLHGESN